MKEYQAFHFEGYEFSETEKCVRLRYSFDHELNFSDTVYFDFDFARTYNSAVLDRVLRGLWLMSGVSYLKAFLPAKIEVHQTTLARDEAEFFSKTYRLGLGQLCYENQLSLTRVAEFPAGDAAVEAVRLGYEGDLLALGGGKDSLVSASVLDAAGQDYATISATYEPAAGASLAQVGEMLGHEHLAVRREFDPQLFELGAQGAYNGHVPVTAIISFIGLAAAVLTGRSRFILSNEASAGEGNLKYEGAEINHQYSKSLEFERELQQYLKDAVSPDLECWSLLRPLGELAIAELFSHGPFERFGKHFSSCNRSFRRGSEGFTWCGECPKCAFVFLVLAPFVPKEELVRVLGADLLAKPSLESTYREMLGLSGHKPFECVGEIIECQEALRMVQAGGKYPEAARFVVPVGRYDYSVLHPDVMPLKFRHMVTRYIKA